MGLAVTLGFVSANGFGMELLILGLIALWCSMMVFSHKSIAEYSMILSIGSWFLPTALVNLGFKSFNQIELSLLLIGIPFLAQRMVRGVFRWRAGFWMLIIAFFLFYIQAAIRSPIPSFSRASMDGSRQIYDLLLAIICYLVIINLATSREHIENLARSVFIGSALGVILSIILFLVAPPSNELVSFSGLGYKDYGFAGYESVVFSNRFHIDNGYPTASSMAGIALLLAFGNFSNRWSRSRWLLPLFLVGFLMGGRAGILAFVIAIGWHFLINRRRVERSILVMLVVLIVFGMVGILMDSTFSAPIARLLNYSITQESSAGRSVLIRLNMWSAAWQGLKGDDLSMLFGSGTGSFLRVVGPQLGFFDAVSAMNRSYTSMHSLYMDAFLTTGIVGVVIIIILLIVSVWVASNMARWPIWCFWSRVGDWLSLMLVYTMVTGLAQSRLNNPSLVLYISLVSASVILASCREKETIMETKQLSP